MAVDDSEWVLLRSFANRAQAELLGELLGNAGVEASVEGAFAAGVLPGVESARVMVLAEHLDDARRIAEAFEGGGDEAAT